MSAKILALLVACGSGVTMAVQGAMNSMLGKIAGLWEATFIVHLIGLVFVSILLFVVRLGSFNLGKITNAPWYIYLGGVLGVLIVYMVARSIPRVGAAPATTAIIIGQVLTATLIDHLGLFGLEKMAFHWIKMVGIALLAVGGWLLLRY